jgi:hypothetical protein
MTNRRLRSLPAAPAAIVVAAAALGGLVTGCGTAATRIHTTPADARIYVNGKEICKSSPCTMTSNFGLPHRAHLEIRRPGYKDVDLYLDPDMVIWMRVATRLSASYYVALAASATAAVNPLGGSMVSLVAVPIEPFTYRMPYELTFKLEPAGGAPPPPAAAPPPPPAAAPPPYTPPPPAAAPPPYTPPPGATAPPPIYKPAPPAPPPK